MKENISVEAGKCWFMTIAILTSTRGALILLSLVYRAITCIEPTSRRLSRRRRETLVAGGCGLAAAASAVP